MPFYGFNTNVPNGPDDAADDQPDMLTNTISTDGIINVDHYSFNGNPVNNKGGYHRQMTLLNVDTPTSVPLVGESGYLLSKHKNNNAWPAWYNSTNQTSNAAITFMIERNKKKNAGYQYLPGGLLMQWGVISFPSRFEFNNIPFSDNFSIPFSGSAYSLDIQPIANTVTSSSRLLITIASKTSTKFTFSVQLSAITLRRILWTAIGKAKNA